MRPIATNHRKNLRVGCRLCPLLLFALAVAPAVKGEAPIDPLPVPDYSFDLASWTVGTASLRCWLR